MHTSLRVTGVLSGVESSVVLGLGFGGWTSAGAGDQPSVVVPTHPRRRDVLQVVEGADRPGPERGALADALGLVEADRRLAQRVVARVSDRPDRRPGPLPPPRFS